MSKSIPKVYHFGSSKANSGLWEIIWALTRVLRWITVQNCGHVINLPTITNPQNNVCSTFLKHDVLREHVFDTSHHVLSLALCQLDRGRRLKHVTELSDLWYSWELLSIYILCGSHLSQKITKEMIRNLCGVCVIYSLKLLIKCLFLRVGNLMKQQQVNGKDVQQRDPMRKKIFNERNFSTSCWYFLLIIEIPCLWIVIWSVTNSLNQEVTKKPLDLIMWCINLAVCSGLTWVSTPMLTKRYQQHSNFLINDPEMARILIPHWRTLEFPDKLITFDNDRTIYRRYWLGFSASKWCSENFYIMPCFYPPLLPTGISLW